MMNRRQKKMNTFYRVNKVKVPTQTRRQLVHEYYQHPRQKTQRRIIVIISLIALVLIWQGILQVPWFRLSKTTIKGLTYIPAETIQPKIDAVLTKQRWIFFQNSNFFLFQSFDLADTLQAEFALKDIKIAKHFPQSLEITATESIAAFVRQTPAAYFELSYTGQTLGQIQSVPERKTVIADERADQSQDISLTYLQQASDVLQAWDLSPSLVTLEKFHLTDDADTMMISVDKGYRIYLSPQEDYAKQLGRYKELLSQNYLPTGIQYLDLRFGNYLYYK